MKYAGHLRTHVGKRGKYQGETPFCRSVLTLDDNIKIVHKSVDWTETVDDIAQNTI
jgi:hypothetical protein